MKRAIIFSLSILFLSFQAAAQDSGSVNIFQQYQVEIVLGVALVVSILALLALIVSLVALRAFTQMNEPQPAPVEEKAGFWSKLWQSLNQITPVAREHEIMTDHEYDGIRELDNKLPPWWLYGFYFTILFAIGYLLHFHVFKTGSSSEEEYALEVQRAEEQMATFLASQENLIDESNVSFLEAEAELQTGGKLFTQYCAACHGNEGQGGVGPNLTDQYWLHGGSIGDIYGTIRYGVPAKGMIAWESQLSPKQMQQLSSFIITLEGTNPPGQKEPQGEMHVRPSAADSTQTVAIN